MDKQMKCSQCGGKDLEKVDFPYEVELGQTGVGLSGYCNSYDLDEAVYCNSYICVDCGHFEFFNLKLAEQIKSNRVKRKGIEENIKIINNEITELTNRVSDLDQQIEELQIELSDLDITVRRHTEIQVLIDEYKKDIKNINQTIKKKEMELANLEKKLNK